MFRIMISYILISETEFAQGFKYKPKISRVLSYISYNYKAFFAQEFLAQINKLYPSYPSHQITTAMTPLPV